MFVEVFETRGDVDHHFQDLAEGRGGCFTDVIEEITFVTELGDDHAGDRFVFRDREPELQDVKEISLRLSEARRNCAHQANDIRMVKLGQQL